MDNLCVKYHIDPSPRTYSIKILLKLGYSWVIFKIQELCTLQLRMLVKISLHETMQCATHENDCPAMCDDFNQ